MTATKPAAKKRALQKVTIFNRVSAKAQFTTKVDCTPDALPSRKLGLAVVRAHLSGADLSGADLRGAHLRDADLRWADLSGADLRGAHLRECPVIRDIHKAVLEAASAPNAFDAGTWHRCETTHCRAGWVVVLAGDGGAALERTMGTPAAAAMIYMASDPELEKIPDFYATSEAAMEDMKRLAVAA